MNSEHGHSRDRLRNAGRHLIRDYIHVMNLADAYVRALQCLCDGGESYVFNCGYGHGFSVRQVADVASRLIGNDIPIKASPRREGAPPVLVADCTKLKQKLDWKLSYDDLEIIIKTARYWGEKSVQR